jgi:solute carrier family 25 (mitochondrial citrate transporter), member 1
MKLLSPLHSIASLIVKTYSTASSRYPLRTNMVLGGIIAGVGDIVCQRMFPTDKPLSTTTTTSSQPQEPEINYRRTFEMTLIRSFVMAPFLYVYFPFLARLVPGQDFHRVFLRVCADQAIGSPVSTSLVFAAACTLQGHPEDTLKRITENLIPTWKTGATYWPIVHSINFKFVPVPHQPLVAHVMSVYWNVILSYYSNSKLGKSISTETFEISSPLEDMSNVATKIKDVNLSVKSTSSISSTSSLTSTSSISSNSTRTEHRFPLLAGGLAGALEISITYPLEYIKTQLQVTSVTNNGSRVSFTGSFDCAKRTIDSYGVFGLYRGFLTNFLGAIPRTALRFATFERIADYMQGDVKVVSSISSTKKGQKTQRAPLTPLQSFTAGLVSGVIEAVIIIVPMTTLQVKLISDLNRDIPQYTRGMVHAISTIVKEEGLSGLYRGATPTILKIAFNISFRFLMYNELVAFFQKQFEENKRAKELALSDSTRFSISSMTAGSIAGAVTVLANQPIDVVKSNMQSVNGMIRYTSSIDCFQKIWKEEGVKGLYRGLVPRLNRVVLETSLSFTFFELLSRNLNKVFPEE